MDGFRELLACPACADALAANWACRGCGERFETLDGIPNLRLPGDGRTDAELLAPWTLKSGSQIMFTLPRISAIRSFVMNHTIHHRGQLSVYLRLRNVPLPSIYGPTADEP